MRSQHFLFLSATLMACSALTTAQDNGSNPTLHVRPAAAGPATSATASPTATPETPAAEEPITLTVASNTPLQIAVDQETRVRKAGQAIRGHLVQPVYAFDRLVLPVGTEVDGRIRAIGTLGTVRPSMTTAPRADGRWPDVGLDAGFDEPAS